MSNHMQYPSGYIYIYIYIYIYAIFPSFYLEIYNTLVTLNSELLRQKEIILFLFLPLLTQWLNNEIEDILE